MADFYMVGNAAFAPASGRIGSPEAPWVHNVDTITGAGRWGGGHVLHLVPNTGWDAQPALFSVPNHGAPLNNPAIIDMEWVDIKFVNPLHYVWNTRANTVIRKCASMPCLTIEPSATDCAYVDINFVGPGGLSTIRMGTTGDHRDIRLARCTFTNPTTPPAGGTLGALVWRLTTGQASSISRMTMEDCTFKDFKAIRGIVCIIASGNVAATSRCQDLIFRRLKFENVTGLPLDIEAAGPQSLANGIPIGTPDWSAGLIVEDIEFKNVSCQTMTAGSYFGGGLFAAGFGLSPTPGFGPNMIGPLYGKNLSGDAGLCDLLYGTYLGKQADFDHPDYPSLRGKSLWVDGIDTPNIDGNVILFDIGCYNTRFEGIYARNVTGNPAKGNSGCVVMTLDNSYNCVASGIDGDNVKCGLFMGASGTASGTTMSNFTITNVIDYGVFVTSHAALADNTKVVNGVMTGRGDGANRGIYNQLATAWKGEANNFAMNFSGGNLNHTWAADSRVNVDPMLDPTTRRPRPGSPLLRAGKYTGTRLRDAAGRRFKLPAAIGGYDEPMKARASRA